MSIQNRACIRLVFNFSDERGNHIKLGSFTNQVINANASRKQQDEMARQLANMMISSEHQNCIGYLLDCMDCALVRIPDSKIHPIPAKKVR